MQKLVTEQMLEIQQKIRDSFDCVEDWFADPELGFKALPISGYFIRSVPFSEYIARVKQMLPDDVKLMIYDGAPIRLSNMNDTYTMIFGSKAWPVLPEGSLIPKLDPLFLGEATGEPVRDTRVVHVSEGIECHLVINKATHEVVFSKDLESEWRCVVIAKPKPTA